MISTLSVRLAVLVPLTLFGAASAFGTPLILDASFERQAELQQARGWYPNGTSVLYGASWNNWGWSSWTGINGSGAWKGGAIARTEEFAAGWKRAHTGGVFGIIKDRQTMSQTFTAIEDAIGTLSWFDANRPAWRNIDWYGRPNDYSVTLTDVIGNLQVIGNYTSQVAFDDGGWWTEAAKARWYERIGKDIVLKAGMTYTLSFNSLSPYWYDQNGGRHVDDRTTFLDDITLTTRATGVATPEPSSLVLVGIGVLVVAVARRR